MSVAIRLRRDGAKNKPYYRIVVADKRSPRDGKFIELIGTYNPRVADKDALGVNSTVKLERADYWLGQGAQPSDTVRSILKKARVKAVQAEKDLVAKAAEDKIAAEAAAKEKAEKPVAAAPEKKAEKKQKGAHAKPAAETPAAAPTPAATPAPAAS